MQISTADILPLIIFHHLFIQNTNSSNSNSCTIRILKVNISKAIYTNLRVHAKKHESRRRLNEEEENKNNNFVLVAYQITYSTFDCTIITIIIATLNNVMFCVCCLLSYFFFLSRGWLWWVAVSLLGLSTWL